MSCLLGKLKVSASRKCAERLVPPAHHGGEEGEAISLQPQDPFAELLTHPYQTLRMCLALCWDLGLGNESNQFTR